MLAVRSVLPLKSELLRLIFPADVERIDGSGEGLSEEFKTKAATIFEAALKSKIRTELERLEEEYAEAYDSAINEAKDELTEKVDGYLNYVVERVDEEE